MIEVGDRLQAVRDVQLDEATVAEGSKISVSGRSVAGGRLFFDVALADGHVVRSVPVGSLRINFRRL